MRKLTLLSAMVALLTITAGIARALPLVPKVGVKGGINISKVSTDLSDLTDRSNRTGFIGGAWGRLPLIGLDLTVEALYAQKGFADARRGGSSDVAVRYNYIDVPLYVRLGFPLPVVSPYVYAGGQVGFLTSAEGKNLLSSWPSGEWVDIKESSATTAWAMVCGAGAEIGQAHLDLRYNYGLTDINDSAVGADTKDRTFSVMVGFQLF